MKKNKNIIWYILIVAFGLIFVPLIINRLKSNDIVRSESRSLKVDNFENNTIPLSFLIINDKKKKVPQFNFRNQNINLPNTISSSNEKFALLNQIDRIYFEFDKFNITYDAAFELDKLVEIMKKYPEMIIRAESHTDSRGPASYNKLLSERRAKSTVQYVISKGIDENRISGFGIGEENPEIDCSSGCSNDQHAKNRRSEFIIVSKIILFSTSSANFSSSIAPILIKAEIESQISV